MSKLFMPPFRLHIFDIPDDLKGRPIDEVPERFRHWLEERAQRRNDGSFTIMDAGGNGVLIVPPSRPKKRSEPYDFDDPEGLEFAKWVVVKLNEGTS